MQVRTKMKLRKNRTKIAVWALIALIFTSLYVNSKINSRIYANEIDITEEFVDENLRSAILEITKQITGDKNKKRIYESDIDKIVEKPGGTSLKLAGLGIKDLSGLQLFSQKGITWIFLDWNELTDISIISNFKDLTKISFSGNEITDLTPLSSIQTLTNITAINNKISTIEPLQNLKNIQYINFDGNTIKDISVVQNWTELKEMSFQNNLIENIPNLNNQVNLQQINLGNNKIQTISGIGDLPKLEKFEIGNNLLENLEGIQNFNNLKYLSCSNNEITQITEIQNLSNLYNLNINKNQVENINGLKGNNVLEYLYMDGNKISDIETLSSLENLKKYTIYNQTYLTEIREIIQEDEKEFKLPELYQYLYNNGDLTINKEDLKTEVFGTEEYEISETYDYIKIKNLDLKNNDILIKVSDSSNTFLNYSISYDKTAPKIKGVENNKVYYEGVIPICNDDDIGKILLTKNEQNMQYNLNDKISESGNYKLQIFDKVGNETKVEFTIKSKISQTQTKEYKIDIEKENIIGINNNTKLSQFKKLLGGDAGYNIYNGEEELQDNDVIGTGNKLVTEYGKEFNLIVKGDVDGNGEVTATDLTVAVQILLKETNIEDTQITAIDVNNDGKITATDIAILKQVILKEFNLEELKY